MVATVASVRMLQVRAAPGDPVVINELMYNPIGPNENQEFLELYNTTASPISLNGWCFSGITLCFGSSHTIPANGYYVVSPDPAALLTIYGVTADAAYTGALSNSGETITLRDNTNTVINAVTYGVASPWPTSPDGGGTSLELKDPNLDQNLASSWAASQGAPTPRAANSVTIINTPTITNVSDISDVDPSEDIVITANVADADTVDLKYKLNFDADVTVTMLDDGASGDGVAGDDVYGATIPGQAAATLVRFKVEATNVDGTASSPSNDDSINYYGYAVKDSVASNAPILNWYMDDADFDDMHANHVEDNVYLPAVVVYNDKVYDNSLVRIKGEYSRSFPKKSYKFKLPSGHKINMAGGSNREIEEFHINSDYADEHVGRTLAAWWAIEESGADVPDISAVRIQRNGQFEGLYIFAEKYEREWRQDKGYNNGSMIEGWNELVSGDDVAADRDLWDTHMRLDRKDPTRRDYVLDENDIPTMINYMAMNAIILNHDSTLHTNTLLYRSDSTERWTPLAWDLDLLFNGYPANIISAYDTAIYLNIGDKAALQAIYDQPELRAAYYRRLKTLTDQFYANDAFQNKVDEINALHEADGILDLAKWPNQVSGQMRTPDDANRIVITMQKYALLSEQRNAWAMPTSQTNTQRQQVSIAQVVPNATNANEYIRLSNAADTPVDISGWVLEGINYTFRPGTVIPTGGSIYLLRDDAGYKAAHISVLVAGQYTEDLDDLSPQTLTLKTNTGQEIDSYDY